MVREITITDLNKVMECLTEIEFDSRINRYRSPFLYRGLPDVEYHLETSLKRNCKDKQAELEKSILRNFTKYAAIDDPQLADSVWRQLIIGQHHGLPTRLMDWTYSPLVGLHFAVSEKNLEKMEERDCALWKIDIEELDSILPDNYQQKLRENSAYLFTVDMMMELVRNIEDYDADMQDKSMVLLEPPSIDQRIINQYSYFSVIPKGMGSIEDFLNRHTHNTVKYVIKKNIRWQVRDMLDQINMNERIMYPGLDGLSLWLTRHYYCK